MSDFFTKKIEKWYEENGRALPWRDTKDAYRIWVSEIILQQTRVAQGYDYFVRFVRRFPTVQALAEASEDEVLKYWQGLGYYSRARNLHAAAQRIQARGEFPRTYKEVRELKGVGDYTAAAICSFAYGLPHAVVDGNVYRVLARYFDLDTPIDSTEGKKSFAELADAMLDRAHSALYNQAIMDFGAIQCTPRSPACPQCPLSDSCAAWQTGRVAELPVKAYATKVSDRYLHYFYICADGRTLLRKRAGNDIWKGLYEPPLLETDTPKSMEEMAETPFLQTLLTTPDATLTQVRGEVKHLLSHQRLHASFYRLQLASAKAFEADWLHTYQAVNEADLERYAVPRLIANFWTALKG